MTDISPWDTMIENLIASGLELVDPEHRIYADEYREYLKDNLVNGDQLNEIDGYYLVPGFEAENARYAYNNLEFKNGDVIVSTYPKTGTTWMTAIVQNILYMRNPELLERTSNLAQFYLYMEFGPVSKYRVTENLKLPRRCFGTHLPEPLVNMEKIRKSGAKVIYVIRNPKDRAVSWYNFVHSLPLSRHKSLESIYPKDMRQFLDLCFTGKQKCFAKDGEDYFECLKEWYKHKGEKNFKIVVFEELKKNPHAEIGKIADFLGETLTDEEINEVVKNTSFATMKRRAENSGSQREGGMQMFKKGGIGGWKDHLTVAQSELVDRKFKEVLGDTDIQFIYE